MKISAGILIYRQKENKIEVLLVHPGGPFWKKRDLNSWSIPKGEINALNFEKFENEFDFLKNEALRELEEETGIELKKEDKQRIFYLGKVKSINKLLFVFALEKDLGDDIKIKSNLIEIEWKGRKIKIPEVDKASYFDLKTAEEKLVNYQKEIIKILIDYLKISKS